VNAKVLICILICLYKPQSKLNFMKLSLGFSPCPNDTFLFDALVHRKIDTEGLDQAAFEGKLDITKLSYHAYAYLIDQYTLLDAGSALGNNCGPLLIAKSQKSEAAINAGKIAIPGKYTTANFLLSLAYPNAQNKVEMIFSDIETAVLSGKVDAGLIIHENRFTYQDKGLVKLNDLGSFWEERTRMPIPLGGIVIRRDLPKAIQHKVNRVLRRSVVFARENPQASRSFVQQYAQEIEEKVMYQHIQLYVNHFTEDLGQRGRKAVQMLFDLAISKGIIPPSKNKIFLEE